MSEHKKVGLPCLQCGYRQEIPGDCHSRCGFDWQQDPENHSVMIRHAAAVSPKVSQWFRWPLNFDPIWGPTECSAYSETAEKEKMAKPDPFADLLSLLR